MINLNALPEMLFEKPAWVSGECKSFSFAIFLVETRQSLRRQCSFWRVCSGSQVLEYLPTSTLKD
ncbi:MAG: hypothetical protein AAFX80_22615, partial [Cyanobacteria bacterium J06639_18]